MDTRNEISQLALKFIQKQHIYSTNEDIGRFMGKRTYFSALEIIPVVQHLLSNEYLQKDKIISITENGVNFIEALEKEFGREKKKDLMLDEIIKNQHGITSFQNKQCYKLLCMVSVIIAVIGGVLGMVAFFQKNNNQPVKSDSTPNKEIKQYINSTQIDKLE